MNKVTLECPVKVAPEISVMRHQVCVSVSIEKYEKHNNTLIANMYEADLGQQTFAYCMI